MLIALTALIVLGVIGVVVGSLAFPKAALRKVIAIPGISSLLIAAVLLALIYKAAHTLPEDAQLIELKAQDQEGP